MGRLSRRGSAAAVLFLGVALGACVCAAADHLAFPQTPDSAIHDEDLEFCRSLAAQQRPQPPQDGWNGPLAGAPAGMLVYGKMDAAGEGGAPAAKFFIVGTLANVSAEAMVATVGRVGVCDAPAPWPCARRCCLAAPCRHAGSRRTARPLVTLSTRVQVEGTNFEERRSWDSSCLLLKPLSTDGADDIVQWKSDFPWPLYDREFVYRRRLVHEGGGGGAIAVSKAIKASSEWAPVEKSVIRIRDFVQYSAVRPLADGSGCSFAMLCKSSRPLSRLTPALTLARRRLHSDERFCAQCRPQQHGGPRAPVGGRLVWLCRAAALPQSARRRCQGAHRVPVLLPKRLRGQGRNVGRGRSVRSRLGPTALSRLRLALPACRVRACISAHLHAALRALFVRSFRGSSFFVSPARERALGRDTTTALAQSLAQGTHAGYAGAGFFCNVNIILN